MNAGESKIRVSVSVFSGLGSSIFDNSSHTRVQVLGVRRGIFVDDDADEHGDGDDYDDITRICQQALRRIMLHGTQYASSQVPPGYH